MKLNGAFNAPQVEDVRREREVVLLLQALVQGEVGVCGGEREREREREGGMDGERGRGWKGGRGTHTQISSAFVSQCKKNYTRMCYCFIIVFVFRVLFAYTARIIFAVYKTTVHTSPSHSSR